MVVERSLNATAQSSTPPQSAIFDMSDHARIRRIRYGRIFATGPNSIRLSRRLPIQSSIAQVAWQRRFGRNRPIGCRMDYHVPFGTPRVIAIDYVLSDRRAGYNAFRRTVAAIDEIAAIRNSIAIVAHVTNDAMTDRLMERLGYQRHLPNARGRHFIRRFYERA